MRKPMARRVEPVFSEAGRVVTVIYPARNGSTVGRLSEVICADGREMLDSQKGPDRLPDRR